MTGGIALTTVYALTCYTVMSDVYMQINVKNEVYKNGYRRHSCTPKTAKVHHFVEFITYCFFNTVPVAFYGARSDDTIHYKSDEMVNFSVHAQKRP